MTYGAVLVLSEAALLTWELLAVREPGSYRLCRCLGSCSMITAAMPDGSPTPRSSEWTSTVTVRIRAVLHAALQSGHPNLVLGAWGCGAFGNPPREVAQLFCQQLASDDFRGAFDSVVFAIIDPKGDGNLRPFREVLQTLCEVVME
uniref:NPHP3 protein n=1 Tax=Symbiodinium pilosum TaxID=2952 RepID=A0A812KD69_SYMPI|nr:NPHP3 [Symbiodinium pilosum]